jgi:hypothetical protein
MQEAGEKGSSSISISIERGSEGDVWDGDEGEVRVCIHLNLCGHTPEMPEAGRYTCTPVAAHNLIDGRVTDGLALGLHFSKPPCLSTP